MHKGNCKGVILWSILDLASGHLSSVWAQTLKFFTGLDISYVENFIIYTGTINSNQCGSDHGFQAFCMGALEKPINPQIFWRMSPEEPRCADSWLRQSLGFWAVDLVLPILIRNADPRWALGIALRAVVHSLLRYRNSWAALWISHRYVLFS